ncbi:hypothetical protein EV207_15624, partial [Scopulibacillus darangshiensis]
PFHFLGESYGIENPDITQFLGTSTLDYEYFRLKKLGQNILTLGFHFLTLL